MNTFSNQITSDEVILLGSIIITAVSMSLCHYSSFLLKQEKQSLSSKNVGVI